MDRSWIDRWIVDEVISVEYREGVEYFCDFAFGNVALYIKDELVVLTIDVAIEKYLIGIRLLSIYIRVNLYSSTSIGTYMKKYEKKLQGLEASRIGT